MAPRIGAQQGAGFPLTRAARFRIDKFENVAKRSSSAVAATALGRQRRS